MFSHFSVTEIFSKATVTGGNRNVVHEVPVNVVPQRLWADYQEPDMPDIDVRHFVIFPTVIQYMYIL